MKGLLVSMLLASAWVVASQGCLPAPRLQDGGNGTGEVIYEPGAPPYDCEEVEYRDDLDQHPGCTTEGLTYPAAEIPGYRCAAKQYVGAEDTSKPIVILVHGNSDYPGVWEPYTDTETRCPEPRPGEGAPMLSNRLMDAGFRTYALDMRATQICEVNRCDCQEINVCNYTLTMDHGWGVPLLMHLIRSVLEANPERRISLIGHSYGVTVIRDALRRLFVYDSYPIWERVEDVVLLSGANHGVSSACGYNCCGQCDHMRGSCACEMGDRDAYSPTCFMERLNGAGGTWESPCSDGATAYGIGQACGGHTVSYTTIVMEDLPNGAQKDVCVSEESSYLQGAANRVIGIESEDQTNYFYCGLLVNHFGAARSTQGMDMILGVLTD